MSSQILLMYITEVSGHHCATLAIEKAIKLINPNISVININGFKYVTPITERVVHHIYLFVIKRLPFLWDFLYDNPFVISKSLKLKELINRRNQIKIKELIEQQKCRVVVCSQAFPCGFVAEYKKQNPQSNIKLIAVITDFVPHSFWLYDEIDYYIVSSEHAKQILINKGVRPEKIKVYGIPIDPKFSNIQNKTTIGRELNISLEQPVVLIMGGGHGLGPLKELIWKLENFKKTIQIIVVTGVNKKLFNYIKNIKSRHKIYCLGYVDFVDKLMTVADVIITKPGGITTSEALAKNLPMIIIKPLPGQEQKNTTFLLEKGAAEIANNSDEVVLKLEELLVNQDKIKIMKKSISQIATPDSAKKIAQLAISLC